MSLEVLKLAKLWDFPIYSFLNIFKIPQLDCPWNGKFVEIFHPFTNPSHHLLSLKILSSSLVPPSLTLTSSTAVLEKSQQYRKSPASL